MKKDLILTQSVETVCYGKRKQWRSREEAIKYFINCLMSSGGSEECRYNKVLNDLLQGKTICIDDEI